MFRISLKNVLARKGRLLLTSMAVIASCAFLSGVFVFSDTINASINRLFATAYAQTDAFVRSSNVIEGDFGADTRGRLPDSVIAEVAAVPGVTEARGDVQSFARIATSAARRSAKPVSGVRLTTVPRATRPEAMAFKTRKA